MLVIKSVRFKNLPEDLKAPVQTLLTKNNSWALTEIKNNLWFTIGTDNRIYGYSESQLNKNWTKIISNRKPIL